VGIAKAAASKGHEVTVFTMADGVKLLENPAFTGLCKTPNVKMSFCDHNATGMGISKDGIPQDVICGSQYNNAIMVNISDRVIVL
ncbi:MAG: DsrE family protein, partial [Nitrospirae bacterium]|nr:DsrE family protein [Nitrospirota bacterium]